jgi:hypothetical protein
MRFSDCIFLFKKFNGWFSPHKVILLIRINHFIPFNHVCFSNEMHLFYFVGILFFWSLIIKNRIWICHLAINILVCSFFVWVCLLLTQIRTYYISLRTKRCYASSTITNFFAVWDSCNYCWTSLLLLNKLSLHLYFALWVYNLSRSFYILLICIKLLVVLCINRFIYRKHIRTIHV